MRPIKNKNDVAGIYYGTGKTGFVDYEPLGGSVEAIHANQTRNQIRIHNGENLNEAFAPR